MLSWSCLCNAGICLGHFGTKRAATSWLTTSIPRQATTASTQNGSTVYQTVHRRSFSSFRVPDMHKSFRRLAVAGSRRLAGSGGPHPTRRPTLPPCLRCAHSQPLPTLSEASFSCLSHSPARPSPARRRAPPIGLESPRRLLSSTASRSRRLPSPGPDPRNYRQPTLEEQIAAARPLFGSPGPGHPQHQQQQQRPPGRVARKLTNRVVMGLAFAGAVGFYFANLETVPVSGRRRFNCWSRGWVEWASRWEVERVVKAIEAEGHRFLGELDPR